MDNPEDKGTQEEKKLQSDKKKKKKESRAEKKLAKNTFYSFLRNYGSYFFTFVMI